MVDTTTLASDSRLLSDLVITRKGVRLSLIGNTAAVVGIFGGTSAAVAVMAPGLLAAGLMGSKAVGIGEFCLVHWEYSQPEGYIL